MHSQISLLSTWPSRGALKVQERIPLSLQVCSRSWSTGHFESSTSMYCLSWQRNYQLQQVRSRKPIKPKFLYWQLPGNLKNKGINHSAQKMSLQFFPDTFDPWQVTKHRDWWLHITLKLFICFFPRRPGIQQCLTPVWPIAKKQHLQSGVPFCGKKWQPAGQCHQANSWTSWPGCTHF